MSTDLAGAVIVATTSFALLQDVPRLIRLLHGLYRMRITSTVTLTLIMTIGVIMNGLDRILGRHTFLRRGMGTVVTVPDQAEEGQEEVMRDPLVISLQDRECLSLR